MSSTFNLDSTTEELSIAVNDNGILLAQNPQAPNNVNPGQAFQFTFDVVNQRVGAEKFKYIVKVDDVEVIASDLIDISPGQTQNIVADLPAFPQSDAGKTHKIKGEAHRLIP